MPAWNPLIWVGLHSNAGVRTDRTHSKLTAHGYSCTWCEKIPQMRSLCQVNVPCYSRTEQLGTNVWIALLVTILAKEWAACIPLLHVLDCSEGVSFLRPFLELIFIFPFVMTTAPSCQKLWGIFRPETGLKDIKPHLQKCRALRAYMEDHRTYWMVDIFISECSLLCSVPLARGEIQCVLIHNTNLNEGDLHALRQGCAKRFLPLTVLFYIIHLDASGTLSFGWNSLF